MIHHALAPIRRGIRVRRRQRHLLLLRFDFFVFLDQGAAGAAAGDEEVVAGVALDAVVLAHGAAGESLEDALGAAAG